MLSRPDDWDFTIEGLACQNKEGADTIARVIRELEGRGYITRCRVRNNEDICQMISNNNCPTNYAESDKL